MSKDDTISIMNGSNLIDKMGVLCFFNYIWKMSESDDLTYYQRNWDVILNRAKDYYGNDREIESKQEINTETYLKKKKTKQENMVGIDIKICLKKRNKD